MVAHGHIKLSTFFLAMAIRQAALLLLITGVLGALPAIPVIAMDLTIAAGPPTSSAAPKPSSTARKQGRDQNAGRSYATAGLLARKRGALIAGEKGRRFRKITTYSLFSAPALRHVDPADGARPGLRPASRISGLGTGLGYSIAGSQPATTPNAVRNPSFVAMSGQPAESDGIAFGCRENSSLAAREVTACYVHKVDKAWKTRTYVTKGLADSNPGWGGGLSVGYAY